MNETARVYLERGLTLQKIYDDVYVTSVYARRYKEAHPNVEPRLSMIFAIADYLNVTPQYLMGWTDERNIRTRQI
ncbi:XRE family transcriptional regulator [Leuconostoc falkenbergense]|uniref:XRE family transcriptional regulator n=1 Tax=Leuconostoc falkenbergense TaxID=2766470 RepID=UPI0021AAA0E7|nr:XRE family transcriptional regulator [Leuconostoc falkenbergense]MCT4419587.1 XRE family transcriptional regulator [Leuconostoc falkenbergense]